MFCVIVMEWHQSRTVFDASLALKTITTVVVVYTSNSYPVAVDLQLPWDTCKLHQLETMQPSIPDDILHLICEELSEQTDFDSLFYCAISSRRLAIPALTCLYR